MSEQTNDQRDANQDLPVQGRPNSGVSGQPYKEAFKPTPEHKAPEDQQSLAKETGKRPGEVSPQLGQDSGSDWQESQQMGKTGHGGVQNPQRP